MASAAFGLFCAVSGAGYIVNDILDVKQDRNHPVKCKRPIASGRVPVGVAAILAAVLVSCSLLGAYALGREFGVFLTAYIILTLSYSICLKHILIVDLMTLAGGFVIRAAAGAAVIHVEISQWLLAFTTLLALFLGLAKRRGELVMLEDDCENHRKTLAHYTAPMLDQMLNIAASAVLMTYFLYTFTPGSKTGTQHPHMMFTTPFVIYGLFRYLFLVHSENAGGTPEQVLLEDKPLLLCLILYVVAVAIALKI